MSAAAPESQPATPSELAEALRTLKQAIDEASPEGIHYGPCINCVDLRLPSHLNVPDALEQSAALLEQAKAAALAAVDRFEADLGFTAPELHPMRIGLLREQILDAFEGIGPDTG